MLVIPVFISIVGNGCSKGATQPQWNATNTFTPTSTFTITPTPTNTTTPVPTYGDTFNSAPVVSNWSIDAANSTSAVLPGSGLVFNPAYTSCSPSTGAMEVTLGFTAAGSQKVLISRNLGSPTSMAGKTITAVVDIVSGWNSNSSNLSAEIYVQQGGSNLGLGSAWASIYAQGGSGTYLGVAPGSDSGCVTLSLAIPSSAPVTANPPNAAVYGQPFDPNFVQIWGIQFYDNNAGQTMVVEIKNWHYQ